jgi:hypothetical protein
MDAPKPESQHLWLQQLIGEWTFENEASMGPDQPPIKSSGTERVRTLGDVWVLCETTGNMPGMDAVHSSITTLGFDPKKSAFVGTFIGSMMTHMWIYEGSLDTAQRVLTLNTEGPSFTDDGSTSQYRDTVTIVNADERLLTATVQTADGSWNQFMKCTYRRKR